MILKVAIKSLKIEYVVVYTSFHSKFSINTSYSKLKWAKNFDEIGIGQKISKTPSRRGLQKNQDQLQFTQDFPLFLKCHEFQWDSFVVVENKRASHAINQINQSVSQTVNQSVSQSVSSQSVCESFSQSIKKQSINQSVSQSVSQLVSQSVSQSVVTQ